MKIRGSANSTNQSGGINAGVYQSSPSPQPPEPPRKPSFFKKLATDTTTQIISGIVAAVIAGAILTYLGLKL